MSYKNSFFLLEHSSDVCLCLDKKLNVVALNETAKSWAEVNKHQLPFSYDELSSANFPNINQINQSLANPGSSIVVSSDGGLIHWRAYQMIDGYILIAHNNDVLANLCRQLTGSYMVPLEKNSIDYLAFIKSFYDHVIGQVPGNIYWKNREGIILGCNQGSANFAGFDKIEDLIGKTEYDFMQNKNDADAIRENDLIVIEKGLSQVFEEVVNFPDNGKCIYLSCKSPLIDEDGEVIGIIGASIDITEQKRVSMMLMDANEDAFYIAKEVKKSLVGDTNVEVGESIGDLIRQIKYYYESIIDNMPGNVYWKDRNGAFLGCNNRVIEMAGLQSKSDIIGKLDCELIWSGQGDYLRSIDQKIMRHNKAESLEETFKVDGGKFVTVMTNKVPLHDEKGRVVGILGVSIDITDQKKLEDQQRQTQIAEEKSQAISLLASKMSHNVSTPLLSINAGAKVLEKVLPGLVNVYQQAKDKGMLKETISELLLKECELMAQDIDESSLRINRFMRETLKNIRIGELDMVVLKPFSLVGLIGKTLKNYKRILPDHEWQLIDYDNSCDFVVEVEEEGFIQVMENLLNNAIDAIREVGKGSISIWAAQGEKWHNLYVKDTGKGINDEHVPYIFEPFKTFKANGTGIGLSTCRAIMKSFGGQICCQTAEGKYAEFMLQFPVVKKR